MASSIPQNAIKLQTPNDRGKYGASELQNDRGCASQTHLLSVLQHIIQEVRPGGRRLIELGIGARNDAGLKNISKHHPSRLES